MDASAAKLIGAGIAMFAALGAGIGLGNIFAAWLGALSRNPSAEKKYATIGYVGAGLTEIVALLAFVLASLILFG